MQRTIRLQLKPTLEQAETLRETLRQSTACFNFVASHGFESGEKNGVELHKATYYALREQHPQLPSQLVCAARVKATEAIKSAFALRKKGKKVSCPNSQSAPIRYDARSYGMRLDINAVSLATVKGRQIIEYSLYAHAIEKLTQAVGFDSADVFERNGVFWLHVVVSLPKPDKRQAEAVATEKVIGVDFGICRPAVSSDNRFFGERRWKNIEKRYFRLKRKLQSKGSASAKRHLKKLAKRVSRFRSDCDHVVSRRVVQSVPQGATIVIENLTEIRTGTKQRGAKQRRAMHQWPFKRLADLLAYKAEEAGCEVVGIDPRHTSQVCSCCGFKHRSNRRSQSQFKCRQCNFELNADLVGSRNIRNKYLVQSGKSTLDGASSIALMCWTPVQTQALSPCG